MLLFLFEYFKQSNFKVLSVWILSLKKKKTCLIIKSDVLLLLEVLGALGQGQNFGLLQVYFLF